VSTCLKQLKLSQCLFSNFEISISHFMISLTLDTYPVGFEAEVEARLAMTDKLKELLEKAKDVEVSPEQKEEQRRSFAYGNTNIENSRITRETVDREAEKLKKSR
jgi:hypothetical protein